MTRAEPLRALLADEQTAKSLHDLKAALRILGRHGADLAYTWRGRSMT